MRVGVVVAMVVLLLMASCHRRNSGDKTPDTEEIVKLPDGTVKNVASSTL